MPRALEGLVEDEQPIGLGEGQRLDQDAVDDAEQRGIDADAEREAEDDDGGDDRSSTRLRTASRCRGMSLGAQFIVDGVRVDPVETQPRC